MPCRAPPRKTQMPHDRVVVDGFRELLGRISVFSYLFSLGDVELILFWLFAFRTFWIIVFFRNHHLV